MGNDPRNVLFLCIANSARSIMAEAILNRAGLGRFRAFSAGSAPAGHVDPAVLEMLRRLNHPTTGLRSKSWLEFSQPDAPVMDFVFTVCDETIEDACPVWPGDPVLAHWGVPDPVALHGLEDGGFGHTEEKTARITDVYRMLSNRIGIFANLPLTALDRPALVERLRAIGGMPRI